MRHASIAFTNTKCKTVMNSIPLLEQWPVGENKKLPLSHGDFYGHRTWRHSLFANVCATASHTFCNSARHGWDQRGVVKVSFARLRNSPLESWHWAVLLLMLAQLGLCPSPNDLLQMQTLEACVQLIRVSSLQNQSEPC